MKNHHLRNIAVALASIGVAVIALLAGQPGTAQAGTGPAIGPAAEKTVTICHPSRNGGWCTFPSDVSHISLGEALVTNTSSNPLLPPTEFKQKPEGVIGHGSFFTNTAVTQRFKGDFVSAFRVNGTSNDCAGVKSGGKVVLVKCSSGKGHDWVYDPDTNQLVNIYETNRTAHGATIQDLDGATATQEPETTATAHGTPQEMWSL